jgi:hypothetical protein
MYMTTVVITQVALLQVEAAAMEHQVGALSVILFILIYARQELSLKQ